MGVGREATFLHSNALPNPTCIKSKDSTIQFTFKTMGKEENGECVNKHKQHPSWVDFIGFAKFQSEHLHHTPFYRLRRIESHTSSAEMVLR